jgi:hypothetical protein
MTTKDTGLEYTGPARTAPERADIRLQGGAQGEETVFLTSGPALEAGNDGVDA